MRTRTISQNAAPPKAGRPADWQEEIKADLARQVEAGATLCGVRRDGAEIARSKSGDRVIEARAKNAR